MSDSNTRSVSTVDLSPTPSTAQRASRAQDSRASSPRTCCRRAKTMRDASEEPCAALLTSRGAVFLQGHITHRTRRIIPRSAVRIRSPERYHLSHPIRTTTAQHPSHPKHSRLKIGTALCKPNCTSARAPRTLPDCPSVHSLRPSPHICCRTPSVTGPARCHWTGTKELLTEFALVVKPGRRSRLVPLFQFGSV